MGTVPLYPFIPDNCATKGKVIVNYTYDAWNRLVRVKYENDTRAEYQYNGLNWRIFKRADTSSPPNGTLNHERAMYYSAEWQLLEEHIHDIDVPTSPPGAPTVTYDRHMQYLWGTRYIDDIVLRRQDSSGNGTFDTTWYHLTDTLFSTVAILDDAANLVERVSYTAYGYARHHHPGDLTGDGAVTSEDVDAMADRGVWGVGDITRTGAVNGTDQSIVGTQLAALRAGRISATDNIIGYAGYVFNAEIHGGGLYTVRHRHFSPELGRWFTRDPLGYVDGMSLYEYVRGRATNVLDPLGLLGLRCNWWSRGQDDADQPDHETAIVGVELQVDANCEEECGQCNGTVSIRARLMVILRSSPPGSNPGDAPLYGPILPSGPGSPFEWHDTSGPNPFPWPDYCGPTPFGDWSDPGLRSPYLHTTADLGDVPCDANQSFEFTLVVANLNNAEDRQFRVRIRITILPCGRVSYSQVDATNLSGPPFRRYPDDPWPVWDGWDHSSDPPFQP